MKNRLTKAESYYSDSVSKHQGETDRLLGGWGLGLEVGGESSFTKAILLRTSTELLIHYNQSLFFKADVRYNTHTHTHLSLIHI